MHGVAGGGVCVGGMGVLELPDDRAFVLGCSHAQGLSAFSRSMAIRWLRRMSDAPQAEFEHARGWLVNLMNSSRPAPPTEWQRGCPEIIPGLEASPFWDPARFDWAADLASRFADIRAELLSLRGKGTCWRDSCSYPHRPSSLLLVHPRRHALSSRIQAGSNPTARRTGLNARAAP